MRRIKTSKTFLLSRCYGPPSDQHLVVGGGMAFALDAGDVLPETALWKALPDELAAPAILDHVFPKPTGEVLVAGAAMAPQGSTVSAMALEFAVGAVRRALAVFGDRKWQHKAGLAVFSAPERFSAVKLSPARAYGGESFAENPAGMGHRAADLLAMGLSPPLPNIERADRLIGHIDDVPAPAIVGPMDFMAASRQQLAGTYDAAWLAKRRPGLPDDADARLFHAAQPEQRLPEGYFDGDEEFEIAGMHPVHTRLRGTLPGLRPRAFARVRLPGDVRPVVREIALRCDTVWLLGSALIGATIWRGSLPTYEPEAADVDTLMLAVERMGDTPRGLEHYQDQMRLRTDRATAGLYGLRSAGIAPEPTPEERERRAAARERARQALEAQNQRMIAYFLAQAVSKLDPAMAHLVPEIKPRPLPEDYPILTPEDIEAGDVDIEAMTKYSEKQIAAARALAPSGEDGKTIFGAVAALARGEAPGAVPAPYSEVMQALAHGLSALDEAKVEPDATIAVKLPGPSPVDQKAAIRAQIAETLGRLGQPQAEDGETWPQARARALGQQGGLPEELMRQAQDAVAQAASAAGTAPGAEKFAALDPSAAAEQQARMAHPPDPAAVRRLLANLLSEGPAVPANATTAARETAAQGRAALAKALEKANAAMPGGPPLEDLVVSAMAMAPSDAPSMAQAPEIVSKQLAEADAAIRKARSKINLARRIAPKATMPAKPLHEDVARQLGTLAVSEYSAGRSLSGLDFAGASAPRARFAAADAQGSFWERARLAHTDWTGASLAEAVFTEADLAHAVLADADLRGANLSGARLAHADLSRADLREARLGEIDLADATLDRAVFDQTTFLKANLVRASLRGAHFEQTTFIDCDLSGADLREASFERCIFNRTKLVGARAAKAVLVRCAFTNVDARDIDLSGAHMERVAAVGECDFRKALFIGARASNATWMNTRLDDADLSGAQFSGAVMQEARLRGACLRGATLRRAMLRKADLQGADLEAADLFGASLRGADLSKCTMRGANLYGADMEGAALRIADLTDANLHLTLFDLASL
jgi:uncharacterized protein YjbI with pentapeptide repeats